MRLAEALEIADICGLETKGEAVNNIMLHVLNLFVYEDIDKELAELVSDAKVAGVKFSNVCGYAILDEADSNELCYMCRNIGRPL